MNKKEEDDKIRKALKLRSWNETKTYDSWQIFKIMAEFVEGFEKLARIGPCVSIFGSARTRQAEHHYQIAEETAYLLRSPKNAARLVQSIEEIEAGKAKERQLLE